MSFADNLQQFRKKSNLSQEKLAENLHITRQAISKWESGQSTPDIDTCLKLCEILGVSPNQLLLGEDMDYSSDTSQQKNLSKGSSYTIISIFLMIVLFCGTIMLICNLYNGNYFEPNIHTLSIGMIYGSIITFVVFNVVHYRRKTRK